MERYEIKSRVDAKLAEGKRKLDAMRVKANESEGDAAAAYHEHVARLEKQHGELKAKAAKTWDAEGDRWESAAGDLESALDEWTDRASRTPDDLKK